MRSMIRTLRLLSLLGAAGLLSGCCPRVVQPEKPRPPRSEYLECRHPKLAEVDECLGTCAGLPPGPGGTCRQTCCGIVNEIGQATSEEKEVLRHCRSACR